MKTINLRYKILTWDLEYWENYIYQYENKLINCDEKTRLFDLRKCKLEYKKVNYKANKLKMDNAELFI